MSVDKSWMNLSRRSSSYMEGLEKFLDFAFDNARIDGLILCPCKKCKNAICMTREEAKTHLICDGFIAGYTNWVAHGEFPSSHPVDKQTTQPESPSDPRTSDNLQSLLYDVFRPLDSDCNKSSEEENETSRPNQAAEMFYKMIKDTEQELFPGSKKISKLSFIVRMLYMKCIHKWSDKSFQDLLDFLSDCFPEEAHIPKSYYEMKKVVKGLGLGYEQYDACINDCMLYWGENEGKTRCKICSEPRWLSSENNPTGEDPSRKGVAAKVVWHFPLKPRLQRLFMSPKTASLMRWHAESRL